MRQPKSKKPRKQRKFLRTAALHVRRKMIAGHLSKELREKYGRRSLALRRGDEIEVMRGKFKKRTGRIAKVDTKGYKVYVDGIMIKSTDGTERQASLRPSKLRITKLNLDDKERLKILERKGKKAKIEKPVKTKNTENVGKKDKDKTKGKEKEKKTDGSEKK